MGKRNDIIDGRQSHLKYGFICTEVPGWIDPGHAQGNDIRTLLRRIDSEESSGKERYEVTYSQSMIDPTCDLFELLRPVSKAEALKRWDYYGKIGS